MSTAVGAPPGVIGSAYVKQRGPVYPPGTFDPLSIPWQSAFWAWDPNWIPPPDGGKVSSWRNAGSSAANITNATSAQQPTYRAAYSNLNARPVVEFAGLGSLNSASIPVDVQPTHSFIVGWADPTKVAAAAQMRMLGAYSSGGEQRVEIAGTQVRLYAGAENWVAGAGRSGAYALSVLYNNAATKVRMNGTNYVVDSGFPVGTASLTGLIVGSSWGNAQPYFGGIAFLGVSATELTPLQIHELEQWARELYGVPVPNVPYQSGLITWLDASDASTFTFSSGALVSQWRDKSPSARHFAQATTTMQPARNGTQNGQTTVTFDSVDDFLQTAVFTMPQPFTVCAVLNHTTEEHQAFLASQGGSFQIWSGAGSQFAVYAGTNIVDHAALSYIGAHAWTFILDGANSRAYRDRTVSPLTTNPGTSGTTTGLYLGPERNKASGYYLAGAVSEVLIYDHALTTAERSNVETYLKAKWGTP